MMGGKSVQPAEPDLISQQICNTDGLPMCLANNVYVLEAVLPDDPACAIDSLVASDKGSIKIL